MGANKVNSVFYADTYHPIQAGSIDGTDILPHDNAVYRALLCSSAGLYDPFGDPKVTGDPYCTVFVGRLSQLTTEDTLHKAMSKYGRVKNLRLVRHVVTGASRGYAFVEYETEKEMRRAYEDAHHSIVDDREILVDYNRQQLMSGWIPRRLGGGLGGNKESGQLRFGGRERPFRAPLRPIPFDDLKRLGIPPPPEGRYMSRFQVPSPPRRSSMDREEHTHKRNSVDRGGSSHRKASVDREERSYKRASVDREDRTHKRSYKEREERSHKRTSADRDRDKDKDKDKDKDGEQRSRKRSYMDKEEHSNKSSSVDREKRSHKTTSTQKEEYSHKRSYMDREEYLASEKEQGSHKYHKHSSHRRDRMRCRSPSRDQSSD